MSALEQDNEGASDRPRVVILGGGFGGLNAAKALRRADAEIYLVDRQNYHLFQPLLYQVATAGLGPEDIASPIRAVFNRQDNMQVVMGRVERIDRQARQVVFDTGKLVYDYLVVATGMETNYFGNEDWEVWAPGLKTLDDALECRRRILKAFERAEWSDDPQLNESLLTFVIVGAGPTGVEMAGAIREIAYKVMADEFERIDPTQARVILVDAQDQVLPGYSDEMSARAKSDLEAMGIEVRLNAMVDEIDEAGVVIGGQKIKAHTVIWAAGVQASPVAQSLDCELDKMGRVIVDKTLRIPGDERVFVIGDLAHFQQDGQPLPGLAPVAIQQGQAVGRNLRILWAGGEPEPFEYRDKGKMATLGRARAIAEIGDHKFGGLVAWLLWLFVHLLFLIGFRNRLFVILDWFYAYVGMRRSGRLILGAPAADPGPAGFLDGRDEAGGQGQIDRTDRALVKEQKVVKNRRPEDSASRGGSGQ